MVATTEIRMNATSAGLLRQAEDLLRAGDKRRASGKAWEAVGHCLRTVADARGWKRAATGTHDEVGDLLDAASRLADESDDPDEIRDLYMVAGSMYVNSLEDWHTAFTVEIGIRNAKELIAILERIAEPVRHG